MCAPSRKYVRLFCLARLYSIRLFPARFLARFPARFLFYFPSQNKNKNKKRGKDRKKDRKRGGTPRHIGRLVVNKEKTIARATHSKQQFCIGDELEVELKEVRPIAGSLLVEIAD